VYSIPHSISKYTTNKTDSNVDHEFLANVISTQVSNVCTVLSDFICCFISTENSCYTEIIDQVDL